MERWLNIGAELERSVSNGPGVRYVVWLQGCPLRCTGCCNSAFQTFTVNRLVRPQTLAARILSTEGICGVTYSGGEPVMQAEQLVLLSQNLKDAGLTIVCYSGFTLDELERMESPAIRELLGLTDILIDGRYEREKKAALLWRGSSNQAVHFLSGRYLEYRQAVERPTCETEIVVGTGGIVMTGNIQGRVLERFKDIIRSE